MGSSIEGALTMYTGTCRCAALQVSIDHGFGPVVSCHCAFCRRIHGAAFTTVAFVPRASIRWARGEAGASVYVTPYGNRRFFCGTCASPLFNVAAAGELAAVVIGCLQDAEQPAPWAHVNTESKAPWHRICDGLPEFPAWPPAAALRTLADEHRCQWLPDALLLPSA